MSDFKKVKQVNLKVAKEIRKNLDSYIRDLEKMKEGDKNIDSLMIEGSFWTNSYFICSNAFKKFCEVWATKHDEGKKADVLNTELILNQAIVLHDKGMKGFMESNIG